MYFFSIASPSFRHCARSSALSVSSLDSSARAVSLSPGGILSTRNETRFFARSSVWISWISFWMFWRNCTLQKSSNGVRDAVNSPVCSARMRSFS